MSKQESLIEELYGKDYRECVNVARTLFTEESTIQSASATMFIQLQKAKQNITPLQKRLQERISKELPTLLSFYLRHYTPHINVCPNVGNAITHWFTELGVIDFKEMDERVTDYMARNGYVDMDRFLMEYYTERYHSTEDTEDASQTAD